MKLFINIVMKRFYLFHTVSWNCKKKIGFPVCKKENFASLRAQRKRRKNSRASPTPHHTSLEEQSARFIAQPLSALLYDQVKIKKSKVASRVIRAMESESEELERFHFLQTLLMTKWKPDCRSRKQKREDKPVTKLVPALCDWFSCSASPCDSDNLVFTRS